MKVSKNKWMGVFYYATSYNSKITNKPFNKELYQDLKTYYTTMNWKFQEKICNTKNLQIMS